jgi:hypothetical protein
VVLLRWDVVEVERGGLRPWNAATSRNSPLFTQAVKAHDSASSLLSKIAGLSLDDRLRIEAGLKELRSRLDQVPAFVKAAYPASVAS